MARDLEQLADDLAQAASDVRWAQDWRDVGDLLERFEQRVRDIAAAQRDIPRERVEALHAAVAKRVEQLAIHGGGTVGTWLHAELSEVAEALRLLLEVEDE